MIYIKYFLLGFIKGLLNSMIKGPNNNGIWNNRLPKPKIS